MSSPNAMDGDSFHCSLRRSANFTPVLNSRCYPGVLVINMLSLMAFQDVQ